MAVDTPELSAKDMAAAAGGDEDDDDDDDYSCRKPVIDVTSVQVADEKCDKQQDQLS